MAASVTQEEISIGEQSAVSIPDCTILSSNLKANLTSSDYPKPLQIMIECLKSSVLLRALTIHREIPKRLVNLAFSKATFVKEHDIVSFAVLGERILTISKKNFIRLMGLPNTDNFITPTAEELIGMFNQMGCTPMLTKISQFKKNRLPFQWSFLFTIFKRCLCGRRSGLDSASQLFLSMMYGIYYNVNIDYGSILWYEFSESVRISTSKKELSSHRFWSVIVESAYSIAKIPIDTAEEPKMSFNEFQVPKKIPSQPEFEFIGQIPVSMISRIPLHSEILIAFKSETSQNFPIRVIPEAILTEIQNQNVKVSLKRKEVAESSEVEVVKPKKKKTKLRTLVLADVSEENVDDIEGMEERENPVKKSKRLKKGKKVVELQTPTLEILEKSKTRRLTLNDDSDDDINPLSHVFSIASSTQVINPITEEREVGILNDENMERDVLNLENEPAQEEQVLVSTAVVNEVENEEERGGEESRIENESVNDVVEQEIVNEAIVSEVESEVVRTEVRDPIMNEVTNEAVVTTEVRDPIVNAVSNEAVVTTEVSAVVVNEEVVTENETTEVITSLVNESSSVSTPIPNISSEQTLTSMSESGIFSGLHHLNVTLPEFSPVVPPVIEEATILEDISDGEFLGLSADEEFELAPIPENNEDMYDDANDDQFISMKQFKILNQKLNMIIRFQDLPREKEIDKEAEVEAVVLNLHKKIEAQSEMIHKIVDEFSDFKKKVTTDIENLKVVYEEGHSEVKAECENIKDKIQMLKNLSEQSADNGKNLREELLHFQGMYENEVKKKLDEAVDREEKLQKIVDDSIAHIKVLEDSIKTYDEKAIAEAYNEKVVKHVEMVQQDFIARLSPLINFVKRIPQSKEGVSQSKEGISEVPVSKPFRRMDLHFLKSTVDTSLPYYTSATTGKTQTELQNLTYPMITQHQPEAATQALTVARQLLKSVVISSSVPQMTTSTIVSTVGEGSSLHGMGKGKQALVELTKEEQMMKEADAIEKLKQKMSLMRQGDSAVNLDLTEESKIWTETTIRDVAFGEDQYFNMLPKVSYDVDLSSTKQLDLPIMPKLFTVHCFMVPASQKLLSREYDDKLIRFYGSKGKLETEVWNSNPIIRVLKVTDAGLFEGVFDNKRFKVLRTDNKEYDFTMADFPTMNPSDLIRLFKLFNSTVKVDVVIFVLHLKKLLKTYVEKFAEKDMQISKALYKQIDKPDIRLSGISKENDGKIIHKPEWGMVSTARVKGKIVKSFMRMDEKGLFDTSALESMSRRIHLNDENSVKDRRELEDQLRWWLKLRKELLDLIPVLYAKERSMVA